MRLHLTWPCRVPCNPTMSHVHDELVLDSNVGLVFRTCPRQVAGKRNTSSPVLGSHLIQPIPTPGESGALAPCTPRVHRGERRRFTSARALSRSLTASVTKQIATALQEVTTWGFVESPKTGDLFSSQVLVC